MATSYHRNCVKCGRPIQMRRMPHGQWLPFEGYDKIHTCDSTAPRTSQPPHHPEHFQPPKRRANSASGYDDLEFVKFTLPGQPVIYGSPETDAVTRAGRLGKRAAQVTSGRPGPRQSQVKAYASPSPSSVAARTTSPATGRPIGPKTGSNRTPVLVSLILALVLGATYLILKRRAQTAPKSNNVAAIQPEGSPSTVISLEPKPPTATEYYEQGLTLTREKKYEEAVNVYRQAITQDSKMANAYHELGFAYLKLGKYKESIEALKQASALKPDNAETYLQLALAHKATARWEEAAVAFEKSIELKPYNAFVHYQLGQVYEKLNDNDAALNTYRETIRLKSDYSLAHYALGLLHLKLGDADAAMSEYEILVDLNKKLAGELYERINE